VHAAAAPDGDVPQRAGQVGLADPGPAVIDGLIFE
jgi:hypothetical protein